MVLWWVVEELEVLERWMSSKESKKIENCASLVMIARVSSSQIARELCEVDTRQALRP